MQRVLRVLEVLQVGLVLRPVTLGHHLQVSSGLCRAHHLYRVVVGDKWKRAEGAALVGICHVGQQAGVENARHDVLEVVQRVLHRHLVVHLVEADARVVATELRTGDGVTAADSRQRSSRATYGIAVVLVVPGLQSVVVNEVHAVSDGHSGHAHVAAHLLEHIPARPRHILVGLTALLLIEEVLLRDVHLRQQLCRTRRGTLGVRREVEIAVGMTLPQALIDDVQEAHQRLLATRVGEVLQRCECVYHLHLDGLTLIGKAHVVQVRCHVAGPVHRATARQHHLHLLRTGCIQAHHIVTRSDLQRAARILARPVQLRAAVHSGHEGSCAERNINGCAARITVHVNRHSEDGVRPHLTELSSVSHT